MSEIDKKILEPSYPLLDKFRDLAPGSFKHCQTVATICVIAANELDLDQAIMECSGLYHDLGKMNNPMCFSENQSPEQNIHDSLSPNISYQLITRHVGDSILSLLQIPNLPIEILNIISQHHGDAVLKQFFKKTKGEPEDNFRYKCSKPKSTEAGILMIVDSVEATARSLFNNNNDKNNEGFIEKAITSTIRRLKDDRQLDDLKIGVVETTKKLLKKELESIYYQKRVSYDEEPDTENTGDTEDTE